MINSSLNYKQRGVVTLVTATALLMAVSLLSVTTADSTRFEQKIAANNYHSQQALEAAEAGLQYGLNYLNMYRSAIVIDNDSSGYIDDYSNANVTNVALANGSSYSIVYTNPTAYNMDFVQIRSTGTNSNSQRELRQLVALVSTPSPAVPIISKGNIQLTDNAHITNTEANTTVWSAQGVTLNSSATTILSSGTSSTSSAIQSDVIRNDNSLNNTTSDELFQAVFGATKTTVKNTADLVYTNGNYNTLLNGQQGKTIWIEGSINLTSNTVVGSAANPITLIVNNGSFQLSDTVIFYGLVYVIGNSSELKGNAKLYGSLIAENGILAKDNANVYYNSSIVNTATIELESFSQVPGGWNDLGQ